MLGKHFISQDIVTKDAKRLITQLATLWFNSRWHEACYFNRSTSGQQLSFEEMRTSTLDQRRNGTRKSNA